MGFASKEIDGGPLLTRVFESTSWEMKMTESTLESVNPSSASLCQPESRSVSEEGQLKSHLIRVGVPPKEIGHLDVLVRQLTDNPNAASNPAVILRLQALSRMDLDFSSTISPKNLKQWGTVVDSIFTFAGQQSGLLESFGMRAEACLALQNKMFELKNKLVTACLNKLQGLPPPSSKEVSELGDVLSRAVSDLTDEGKNQVLLQLQEVLDKNPGLKKPLTKVFDHARAHITQRN